MKAKIDENNKATVILTKAGAETINSYNSFLNKYCSDMHFKDDFKENDEFSAELHTIMYVFYSNSRGTEKKFKEISVETEKM